MEPTTTWTCDSCGELIESARDGWLEWLTDDDADGGQELHGRGMRIVHHVSSSPLGGNNGCYYDEERARREGASVSDTHLDRFVGPDGLMRLLAMIAEQRVAASEVAVIIQRLHIPGYERARPHFAAAILDGEIEPNMPDGFHWQRDIEHVIRTYDK